MHSKCNAKCFSKKLSYGKHNVSKISLRSITSNGHNTKKISILQRFIVSTEKRLIQVSAEVSTPLSARAYSEVSWSRTACSPL